jgi:succinoglycan biosynthesis transport protein ExoP
MNSHNLTIQDSLEIVLKRKWWLFIMFALGTIITFIYSYSLPILYRSSTVIMVEPQKIPRDYVSPTVTSSIQERLATISQQILSRTNLEKIITQFNLYKKNELNGDSLLAKLSRQASAWTSSDPKKILTFSTLDKGGQPVPLEVLVERMRRDIEVRVVGGGNAFTIGYIGEDPLTVMKVTNTLASLFIEENLRIREQQAEGTSEFLEAQLAEAKRHLEKQESALKEFKEKNMGALPGQLDANLRTLDRLQLELQTINDSLRSAEDRKIALDRLQRELKNIDSLLKSVDDQTSSGLLGMSPGPSTSELLSLKVELSKLQAQFNDNYPDIVILKRQISEKEGRVNEEPSPSSPLISGENSTGRQQNVYSTDMLAINSEIESLKRKRESTLAMITQYEKRVENTFANEQTLQNLTRDYEMSQLNYSRLLEKRLNAKISENLEKKQKGEQFRVLDPANLPQKPFKPDRRKIIMIGSLLSGGLGVGLILFKEFLRPTYRKPEDFQGTITSPILVTIPKVKIKKTLGGIPITLDVPDSLIAEQYRILYTRLNQLNQENQRTIFAISSSIKGEGKTVTALNLALVASRDFGKRTLLLEGDLKNPSIKRYLKQEIQVGLVDVILGRIDFQSAIINFAHENLSVLPVMREVKNSSSILSSQQMGELILELRGRYDIIFVDSPPILSLPDMNILERLIDGIILVVRAERTPKDAVTTAIDSLATDKITGIILNDVSYSLSRYHRAYDATA